MGASDDALLLWMVIECRQGKTQLTWHWFLWGIGSGGTGATSGPTATQTLCGEQKAQRLYPL